MPKAYQRKSAPPPARVDNRPRLQDDVVQFLTRLGVEEVEAPIGAFNELYR